MKDSMSYGDDYKYIPTTSTESGHFEKIAEDLWYQTIQIVNLYYVNNPADDEWVLVDAGMPKSANKIIDTVNENFSKPPVAIVLTHGHFDHVGAIIELVDYWKIPVYAHEYELPYLQGELKYPEPDPTVEGGMVAKLSPLFPVEPINLGDKVQPLPEDGSIPHMKDWRWIHTPGHTPGHISLFREKDRTLIAGDAFVTVKQENLYDVFTQEKQISSPPRYLTPNWEDAETSVLKLRDLQPKLAITGHGHPMQGEELHKSLNYLADNFKEVGIPDHGHYVDEDDQK